MNIEKQFQKWCKIKIKLEKSKINYHPKVLDIRNCYFGKNLNGEQNGDENNNFFRPVLIFKTFGKIGNVIVLPLTKNKKPDYISYNIKMKDYNFLKYDSYILLDKIKVLSIKRLEGGKPLGKIEKDDYKKIANKLLNLFTI